ncbi:RhoGAP domain-containing protein [Heterostelium album PN500]|uniref:RhoGAP domain-containing protein n=1 Tax=Heterostelium pallidum (strain ATCC 26659 / Pp 5 / PN500) TaxID=670386 RepID=D3BSP7_HETP5|nr:RhoGAP domain-containing protein [Heterostelium album PN500]EFA75512.1 RhoGAP domain-containing protein [Heterostelium album PN500]|eukprot:XP_020427646.1 RhoGAP domain-containing protein [Heterostelium album PN500]
MSTTLSKSGESMLKSSNSLLSSEGFAVDSDDEVGNITGSQQSPDKKLSFAQDMWEGFDLLCKRTEYGIEQCKELLDFFKKRAALEERYAKSVVDHFSKFKLKDETDSFQRGFLCISVLSESESNIHKSFAQNLINNLCHPFTALVKEMEQKRKNLVNEGLKLRNDYKDSLEAVRKAHQKYEKFCKETESAKIELISMLEKETEVDGPSIKVQTLEKKVAKCEATAIVAEEEYKNQIKETNEFIYGYYQTKMMDSLNEFEQFESMRMQFIKSNIKNYMGLMLETPSALEVELNNGCKQTDWIDPELDIQTFIKNHTTPRKLIPPFQFEPYVEGKLISLNSSSSGIQQQASSPPTAKVSSFKDNILGFFNKTNILTLKRDENPLHSSQSIPLHPIFGTDLEELMDQQKKDFPQIDIPLILINFIQTLLKLNALETEGIFRMSPPHTQLQQEKQKLDEGGGLDHIQDVHLVASLLKHWLRDLPNPIISSAIYDEIIETPLNAWNIIETGIPLLHQRVLRYLIDFFVELNEPEFAAQTKMDCHSLAVVMAPVLIRSNINDPQVALENSKREVKVVECMIVDSLNKKKEQELIQQEKVRSRSSTPINFPFQPIANNNNNDSENNNNNSNSNSSNNNSSTSNLNNSKQDESNNIPSRNTSTLSFGNSDTFSVSKSDSDPVLVESEEFHDHDHDEFREFIQVSNDSNQSLSSDDS